jgi:hypothetical protein
MELGALEATAVLVVAAVLVAAAGLGGPVGLASAAVLASLIGLILYFYNMICTTENSSQKKVIVQPSQYKVS